MSPNVSVILPFFNAEKTLNNAIQSILNQTFQSFELILVDNNSTDNSRKVAESLMETDSRVSLIYEPKQGVAFAMNKGLTISTGKYIARMDADDISMPERIKKQVDYLEQNPDTDLVGSEVKYMPHHKNTKGFRHFINWVNSFHT
ncbi:MAG: glycosyltransferase family 2 protein, partial [Mariniphaga sp.]|nr:glycosyltransferase family 2 protein [Mariniphaga sp.]